MGLMQENIREEKRLAAVHALQILDTAPDYRYDSVTEFAADILGVPICFIAILDSHRQWFKSTYGMSLTESSRDISICTHAIGEITSRITAERIFYVPKLISDERFINNPFVTGDTSARTYISYVLQSEAGDNIGTFCLIDTKERVFTDADRLKVEMIGCIVENILYGRDYSFGIGGELQ